MDAEIESKAVVVSSETGEILSEPGKVSRIIHPGIVKASVTPEEAAAAMGQYQAICKAVLSADDYQTIGDKQYKKRSAWQKLATCWNLSVEAVSEKQVHELDGSFSFDVVSRALAPNGRAVTGDGSANSREHNDQDDTRHNVRGKAHTRAFNRAVANLIAAGEVSSEEMDQGQRNKPKVHIGTGRTISDETVLRFGTEFKGKKLGSVDRTKLLGLINWMRNKNVEENKEFGGQAKEVWEYLQTPAKVSHPNSEDPGNWNPFDPNAETS